MAHPGPAIARIRKEHGLTQAQLSDLIGVPISVLRDIEQGRAGNGHMGSVAAWLAAMLVVDE